MIAGFTNAINHVIHHHLLLTSVLALPPKFRIVHVGRTPSLPPPPTPLSTNPSITHSHQGIAVHLASPHAIRSARNLILHVLIHAKRNATPGLVLLVQLRSYVRAGVDP